MSTKTQIQTLINTKIDTGGNSPALEVREVLNTDANSLLNSFYPTVLTDSQATSTYLTWTASASWTARIVKIGRAVTIDVDVTANGTMQLNAATIAVGELTSDANTYHSVGRLTGGGFIGIVAGTAGISFQDPLLSGERVSFSITYNTLN